MQLDKLNNETAEQLRHLLMHPAWHSFFAQHLEQWRQDAIDDLLNPSEERRKDYPDDFLRGQVATCVSLLQIGYMELKSWDDARAQEAEENAQEKAYDEAADLGVYLPQI